MPCRAWFRAALLAALAASPAAADPVEDLARARGVSIAAVLEADPIQAARVGCAAVREAAAALATLEDDERASRLADEIELTLHWLANTEALAENGRLLDHLLEGVTVPPRFGACFAALAREGDHAGAALGHLTSWQLIGPFDNERGRGLRRTTPPERDPDVELVHPGKIVDVPWRTTPPFDPPDGVLPLGELLYPADQACVLLRTWVELEAARDVALVLGFSEECRVWWNGELAFEAAGEHRLHPDAYTLPLSGRAGWNELLVKVGGRELPPELAARLADPATGQPLLVPSSASAPDGVAPRIPGRGPARWTSTSELPRTGAWARWAQDDGPEGSIARAILHRTLSVGPLADVPGRAQADAAWEETRDPLTGLLRVFARGGSGESLVEFDFAGWLEALDDLEAVQPGSPYVLANRAWHAISNQLLPHRALPFLEDARTRNPHSLRLASQYAGTLAELGQDALATRARLRLVDHPDLLLDPFACESVVAALPAADPRRAALHAAAARTLGHTGLVQRGRREAALASGTWSAERVLEDLRADTAQRPWSLAARLRAAEALYAIGAHERGLVVLDEALLISPDTPQLHRARARGLLLLGADGRAIEALEELVRVDPGATAELRLLEHLRSGGRAPFHEQWAEPLEAVVARHPADPERLGDASREVLLKRVVVDVAPDGTARRYLRLVQRVGNENGARELDAMTFVGAPLQDEIRVLRLDVLRADGAVEQARTARSRLRGRVTIELPPLEPGDVVDAEWRVDDLGVGIFGQYFGLDEPFFPDPYVPVRESEVTVLAPDSVPLEFHTRGHDGEPVVGRDERGKLAHTYRMEDWRPLRPEPLPPNLREWAPAVQVSTYASWEEFGDWWWHLIEEEITTTPEMRAKVAELCADATTPGERLEAIYDFVVTDIRYNAWEFGVHGYEPYSAPTIFSRGFGDCKDKAILLRALLAEVGIDCYPVLVRAMQRRFEEDHSLALVEHFNHCIAFVPEQDGLEARFLDGTARHHPIDVLPDSDRGASVVVVRPDGVDVARVPFPEARDNLLREELRIDLTDRGGPSVSYERASRGRWEVFDRHEFDAPPDEVRDAAATRMTQLLGPLVGPVEVEVFDVDDLGAEAVLSARSRPEHVGRATEGGLDLPRSLEPIEMLRELAPLPEREQDVLLQVPWSRESEVRYVLAEGAGVPELPEPVELDCGDATYRWSAELDGRELVIRERLSIETHRIAVERYAAFRELCRAVDESQRGTVHVEVRP